MRPTMLALALAPTLLVTAAAAQPAPPRGPHGAPQAEMKAHHEAMKKQHMEDLKTVLRLRPDQEAALAAFAASHEPKTFERRLPNPGSLTTPQRLDEMAKVEAEMAAHHKASREALAKFYAALSPDQQKVFDALHRLQGHGGGHGGRRMMVHGPGGPMGHGPGMIMMRRHGPSGPDGSHDGPHDGPDDE
ncbi:Spy/CpxP family protein refolding chaperone [Phenylobacterium sp.]|uniref:Spy/CpxP family protein refolding chaperone n=1 Tax=Phenylobacterium sp. TaxID=1871053 RepID=UPI002ED9575B